MRSIKVLLATTILVLALAGAANAGCMATVGLSSVPTESPPARRGASTSTCSSTDRNRSADASPGRDPDRAGNREQGEVLRRRADRYEGSLPRRRRVPGARVAGRSRSTTASPSQSARRRTRSARSRIGAAAAAASPPPAEPAPAAAPSGTADGFPYWALASRRGRTRGRRRGAGHDLCTSATAVAASPSPRPVKPRPSVVVARTATRLDRDAHGRGQIACASRPRTGASLGRSPTSTQSAFTSSYRPRGRPRRPARGGRATRRPPALVPGREEPADVPEPGGAEHRVDQSVREDVAVRVPDQARLPGELDTRRERAARPATRACASTPIPTLTFTGRAAPDGVSGLRTQTPCRIRRAGRARALHRSPRRLDAARGRRRRS